MRNGCHGRTDLSRSGHALWLFVSQELSPLHILATLERRQRFLWSRGFGQRSSVAAQQHIPCGTWS